MTTTHQTRLSVGLLLPILVLSPGCSDDEPFRGHADAAMAAETVTCRFDNATGPQSCTSSLGQHCEGIGSCDVVVGGSAYRTEPISWHSSCGGEAETALDKLDETIVFDCNAKDPKSETVTCRFLGSSAEQTCSSAAGQCSGVSSCTVAISANAGARLSWTSTCGSSSKTTVVDSQDEDVAFLCGAEQVTETVTCTFQGSSAEQSCFPAGGPEECSGVGSCAVKLEGLLGSVVLWKSSCAPASGETYGRNVLDGQDETIAWTCTP